MIPTHRAPTAPGEVLREEFILPFKMTQGDFAQRIGVPTETVNRIVNGKRGISPEMALRLAAALGTTPQFWLNLQAACDLFDAREKSADSLAAIEPIEVE